jgi:hypothetical protein
MRIILIRDHYKRNIYRFFVETKANSRGLVAETTMDENQTKSLIIKIDIKYLNIYLKQQGEGIIETNKDNPKQIHLNLIENPEIQKLKKLFNKYLFFIPRRPDYISNDRSWSDVWINDNKGSLSLDLYLDQIRQLYSNGELN